MDEYEKSAAILEMAAQTQEALMPLKQRIAELEGEKRTLAKALRVTYTAHQNIHRCTLCLEMWRKLEELTALAPEKKE
jgi:hypothetical protein